MGPYPHDAPKAKIDAVNIAGTDGFEFVEFAHPEAGALETLFETMGFVEVARHKTKDISLYRQGYINYVVNREVRLPCGKVRRRARTLRAGDGLAGSGRRTTRSNARSPMVLTNTRATTRRSTCRR